jgi:prepilin-type processing-associated H-X9-DG protein
MTPKRSVFVVRSVAVLFVLAGSIAASAQTLADRVPADAVAYVGWRGTEALGPGYDASHLKGVIDASAFPQLLAESMPRLLKRIGEDDDDAAAITDLLIAVGGPVWRHPSALYVGGVDTANADAPMPKLGLICEAGAESGALAEQLRKVVAKIDQPPFPIRVEEQGGLVVLAVGKVDLSAKAKPAAALSARREFVDAMAKVGKEPVIAVYVDVETSVAQLKNVIARSAPPEVMQHFTAASDAFGLPGLKRLAWTGGFDGKEWSNRAFVNAPAPRTGLVKFFIEAPPLSEKTLKAIPATATMAAAGHFDFGGLLGTIREMVKKVDANASNEFEAGLDQVKQAIGMDLQADILDTLGGEWAMYSDPAVGGSGILGLTLVNQLNDAAKAERALAQLEQLVNGMIKEETGGGPVTVAFNTTRQGDLTIHYLAIPVIAPSWAIKDGNLYVGLYPQVVSGAVEHAAGNAKSILDNPDYAALRKRLAAGEVTAVGFTDLPKLTAEGYQEILMIARAYLGAADLFGAKTPAMALPPLAKLMPHVTPAASVAWSDAEGWHLDELSPFPGSNVLAAGGMGSGLAALQTVMMGALMPSLARAQMSANRIKSASNLRQIGQAMMLYANENKGKYPREMGELLLTQDIAIDAFVNPQTKTKSPRNKNKEDQAAWVSKDSDYEYLGAGKDNTTPADVVVAHEKIRPGLQGINMLYGDGHVEWNVLSAAEQTLARQRAADMKTTQKGGQ